MTQEICIMTIYVHVNIYLQAEQVFPLKGSSREIVVIL